MSRKKFIHMLDVNEVICSLCEKPAVRGERWLQVSVYTEVDWPVYLVCPECIKAGRLPGEGEGK